MARDAMEGYLEVLIEDREIVPESDPPQTGLRFNRLAHTLRADDERKAPLFEQLTAKVSEAV